jgi:hypothetical protein
MTAVLRRHALTRYLFSGPNLVFLLSVAPAAGRGHFRTH